VSHEKLKDWQSRIAKVAGVALSLAVSRQQQCRSWLWKEGGAMRLTVSIYQSHQPLISHPGHADGSPDSWQAERTTGIAEFEQPGIQWGMSRFARFGRFCSHPSGDVLWGFPESILTQQGPILMNLERLASWAEIAQKAIVNIIVPVNPVAAIVAADCDAIRSRDITLWIRPFGDVERKANKDVRQGWKNH
jgi:hypothetical protein